MLSDTKIFKFFEQVKQEASKVVWSDRKELFISTAVVLFAVFVVSIICLILDYGIHGVISFLLNIGR